MTPPFDLHDETALITGGGTGLGLAIATCLVAAGARVVLVGRRMPELEAACAQLGTSARFVVHDITALEKADEVLAQAERAAGSPISILVNNAGNHLKRLAVETTSADFDHVMRTHVHASHALTRAVLPGMISRRHGNVLFIASMASFLSIPGVVAYAAAKSAYLGMVRTLSAEVAPSGVRVNAIAPGWIDSAMTRRAFDADPVRKQKVLSRTPMGRFGEPQDIGWAAVYLCAPAARFVTGVTLPVDGGAVTGF